VPRKSSAALSVVPLDVARTALRPPPSLTKVEAEVFIELASHATHLKPADAPLLASLAQSIILSRRLARDPARISEWEKTIRAQAMLSTKLRLTRPAAAKA
jgi:hypothetical protein